MPLPLCYIRKEDFAGFMILDSGLEFLRQHFRPEEPAGVAVSVVAIHCVLIGDLHERSTCGSLLRDKFSEAVNLGHR